MLKSAYEAAQALSGKRFFQSNRVTVYSNPQELYYRGNLIAYIENYKLCLSDCGWFTVTTKRYLNAVLNTFNMPYRIYQKDFEWYLYNEKTFKSYRWMECFNGGRVIFNLSNQELIKP